ncbi:MAG: hypothetical protein C6P37_16130 [Caldibacillus debilis]|uniref:Uncharacterized protein n=1 Tax=Caldibacillus debilis TaxID=301148 RepID=A0A3E0JX37_9BACI|nr:MAG: hypothetical protein C6W57_13375 [Caldibacillus debilis]REJ23903.1 MAG: hypothetical protein C6W56_14760 [Caldibacillus debilis]REJ24376.1 MAG: hypothetical protein C6P37_16130 [Caldibacillus debilis]
MSFFAISAADDPAGSSPFLPVIFFIPESACSGDAVYFFQARAFRCPSSAYHKFICRPDTTFLPNVFSPRVVSEFFRMKGG